MAISRGKQFEAKFKENCLKIPNLSIDRLPDQFNGFKNSVNICDFVCYRYPSLVYVELKSCMGNTFSLNNLRQYESLLSKKGIKGIHPTVIIWFIEHDKIIAFPITSIEKMKKEGKKSINIKAYLQYECTDIPVRKRRVLLDGDYVVLFDKLKEQDLKED